MQTLSPEGLQKVTDIANRYGVSPAAAASLLGSLAKGNGYQAQFDHPDLGGMGQWSQGGMLMIGDMFNQSLKSRVNDLCNDLARLLNKDPVFQTAEGRSSQSQNQSDGSVSLFVAGSGSAGQWWPAELGRPDSTGAQNDLRYAFFSGPRRLAILRGGQARIYDTGAHALSGFSQQQSSDQSLTFTSQMGLVRVADLPLVSPRTDKPEDHPNSESQDLARTSEPKAATNVQTMKEATAAPSSGSDILRIIESLAELRQKNILTEEEFSAKKTELLSRL
jgi:hypothetical protein